MTDDLSFLEGIKANPEDLFLRLVYADWLEERGDARSEYLRVDGELHKLMSVLSPNASDTEPKIRQLQAQLKKLAKALDAGWVAVFDALRPEIYLCQACKKVISGKEAIDTDPRNYSKMKTTRYCRPCYEDAVRSRLQHGLGSKGRGGGAGRDYHGGRSNDD